MPTTLTCDYCGSSSANLTHWRFEDETICTQCAHDDTDFYANMGTYYEGDTPEWRLQPDTYHECGCGLGDNSDGPHLVNCALYDPAKGGE